MRNLISALALTLVATSACAATPAPKGVWIQGANKMPIFVAAKLEKNCKYVLGQIGYGPRSTYGYKYTCDK